MAYVKHLADLASQGHPLPEEPYELLHPEDYYLRSSNYEPALITWLADAEDIQACEYLATIEKNEYIAAYWVVFKIQAYRYMERFYRLGIGVPQDEAAALEYFDKSVKVRDRYTTRGADLIEISRESYEMIGLLYRDGAARHSRDLEKTAEYYCKAAMLDIDASPFKGYLEDFERLINQDQLTDPMCFHLGIVACLYIKFSPFSRPLDLVAKATHIISLFQRFLSEDINFFCHLLDILLIDDIKRATLRTGIHFDILNELRHPNNWAVFADISRAVTPELRNRLKSHYSYLQIQTQLITMTPHIHHSILTPEEKKGESKLEATLSAPRIPLFPRDISEIIATYTDLLPLSLLKIEPNKPLASCIAEIERELMPFNEHLPPPAKEFYDRIITSVHNKKNLLLPSASRRFKQIDFIREKNELMGEIQIELDNLKRNLPDPHPAPLSKDITLFSEVKVSASSKKITSFIDAINRLLFTYLPSALPTSLTGTVTSLSSSSSSSSSRH